MNLFIDKENLMSFIQSRKSDKDFFDVCERVMKRQLDVKFNFLKSDITEEGLRTFFCGFCEGCGTSKMDFCPNKVPSRPVSSKNCLDWNWSEYSSIFLVSDENLPALKRKNMVLMGDKGEELKTFRSLLCKNDYLFIKKIDSKQMSSWKQIFNELKPSGESEAYPLPCTDIIINDRYLFKQQKEILEANLCDLLPCLTECPSKDDRAKVNIVIFTLHDFLDVDVAKKIINKAIEKSTGKKPNLTFVTSRDNKLIGHDRFIFTNYYKIESGDSFIYFDTSGKFISNGDGVTFFSLADKDNYEGMKVKQKELNEIVATICKTNNDYIIGDRKSNFIKF